MKILLAVSGGVSLYKVLDVITGLKNNNHEIKVIMSDSAKKLVPPTLFDVISDGGYVDEDIDSLAHISMAEWCDMVVVVPGTANTIGKIANGIADNIITSTIMAISNKKLRMIFPAMNTFMYRNEAFKENQYKLRNRGWVISGVDSGKLACGYVGEGKLKKPRQIVFEILYHIQNHNDSVWLFPFLDIKPIGKTNDSYSFLDLKEGEIEIPIYPHVGAFGIRRRHDIHKGVDLYAPEGTNVYACEDGIVEAATPFTGKKANCPWWNDTDGVYVRGKSGIIVYGEITKSTEMKIGKEISKGEFIGQVATVLKKDKGRPMSMLHLELHREPAIHCGTWYLPPNEKPENLLDPTQNLLFSIYQEEEI